MFIRKEERRGERRGEYSPTSPAQQEEERRGFTSLTWFKSGLKVPCSVVIHPLVHPPNDQGKMRRFSKYTWLIYGTREILGNWVKVGFSEIFKQEGMRWLGWVRLMCIALCSCCAGFCFLRSRVDWSWWSERAGKTGSLVETNTHRLSRTTRQHLRVGENEKFSRKGSFLSALVVANCLGIFVFWAKFLFLLLFLLRYGWDRRDAIITRGWNKSARNPGFLVGAAWRMNASVAAGMMWRRRREEEGEQRAERAWKGWKKPS